MPIFSAICRIFVGTPPPQKFRPPIFLEGGKYIWSGLKKIEARFGLQHAGVENQKKPQVNILESWLNASKTPLNGD
jgi:hypothetical protein